MFKNITIFIILMLLGTLYRRYMDKMDFSKQENNYRLINKYLLEKSKKPIIWIHLDNEYNSMNWDSFYSRGNFKINVPYIHLAVQSIIRCCGDDCNVCLITDNSFEELLPNWSADLRKIGSPLKEKVRYLGLISLLHEYGGLLVPNSFLCVKNLAPLIESCKTENKSVIFENVNYYGNSTFAVDPLFIGANRHHDTMEEFKNYLSRAISNDYTAESIFLNDYSKWCQIKVNENKMVALNGEMIGVKQTNQAPVNIELLTSSEDIRFNPNMYGIFIPQKQLINRKNQKWFCYLSKEELVQSGLYISRFFVR